MDVMGSQYIASVEVGITPDDEFVFYDVVDIIPTSFALKNEPDAPSIVTTNESPDDKPGASASTARVPQPGTDVKQKSDRDMTVYDRTAILREDTVDKYLADYIGLSISFGIFLLIKKYKHARRIVQLLVGLYMLV